MEKTPPPAFDKLLFGLLSRLEMLLLGGVLLGVAFKQMNYPGGDEILMIALGGLAGVFFLMAFRPPAVAPGGEGKQGFSDLLFLTVIPKVAGITCAVLTIGILFTLLHLPGNKQMLLVGTPVGATILLLIGIGFLANNDSAKAQVPMLYRLLPLTGLGAYLLII